jgi:uncharacterized membrane protein YebE (DUF533 family)
LRALRAYPKLDTLFHAVEDANMSSRSFLNHLLSAAQSGLEKGGLAERDEKGKLSATGFGKGALTGGAAALLLGNRSIRRVGGLAALGFLAYKAYGSWRNDRTDAVSAGAAEPQTLDRISAPEQEHHSRVLLAAIVAAAKADGHIDDRERVLIEEGLSKSAESVGLREWLQSELAKPLDPAEIAAQADTPELAAEIYLASVLTVDEQNFMERAYLTELARLLELDEGLKLRLEQQAHHGEAP